MSPLLKTIAALVNYKCKTFIKLTPGHVPIELLHLLKNFLEAETENKLCAQVTGKRKREVGLVVPAKFTAPTSELRIARILERELTARAEKYTLN